MSDFPISIATVTPTYNRARFLERAVDSITAQTYPVKEIIIIDDGSTDDTQEVLAKLAQSNPALKIIVQKQGGANRARNAGLAAATAEWIAFLDSDDSWQPDKLAKQVEALQRRPSAVASFTGLNAIGEDRSSVYLPPEDPSLDSLRCANVLSSTSTALVKKSVLEDVGGFDPDLPSCQDWDLWFRLRQAGPFAIVRESLMMFTAGSHDRISTNYDKVFAGHAIVLERFRAGLRPPKDRKIKASQDLFLANLHLKWNEPNIAFRLAVGSLARRFSPWGARLLITAFNRMVRRSLGA